MADDWPTYTGDYSGKRYSALTQVNQSNVKNLTLAWTPRSPAGAGGGGGGAADGSAVAAPTIVGGEGTGTIAGGGGANIRASILEVNGILYVSTPDNAWAVDARDGHELWHYFWKTKGGTHIGNRGLGMWHNWLYMETPDDYLVCLDAATGKEALAQRDRRFQPAIFLHHGADRGRQSHAGRHRQRSGRAGLPAILRSRNRRRCSGSGTPVPMKKGDPGLETWASLDAARHGGGNMWIPGAYDPETHLYIIGTGNPIACLHHRARAARATTCTPVRSWPSTSIPARWPGITRLRRTTPTIGIPRRRRSWSTANSTASRARWCCTPAATVTYFTLDRLTGEHLVTSKFSESANWAKGINAKGQPVRDPAKDFDVGGALVSPANGGVTNWPPPAYSPDTGLVLRSARHDSYAMYYLTETDPRGAMGLGGKEEVGARHRWAAISRRSITRPARSPGGTSIPATGGGIGNGMLTTAGKLLFAGDVAGNLVAYDPANGKILWHAHLGQVYRTRPRPTCSTGTNTCWSAAGDTLYSFMLY